MWQPSSDEPRSPRTSFRQLFSFVVVSGLICWLIEYPIQPVLAGVNHNHLLVGKEALLAGASPIPIEGPQEFDALTTEEVLRLRMQAVWRHPLLIGKNYEPSAAVFGRIRNRALWRGTAGIVPDGVRRSHVDTLLAESFFVVNPYLLVAAEFEDGVAADAKASETVTQNHVKGLEETDLAWPCRPLTLTWHPQLSRAEVVYDASGYLSRRNQSSSRQISPTVLSFRLLALNALDLNLNYAAILPHEASNVRLPERSADPVLIEQYLRYNKDCGRRNGCNEVSPPQTELAGFSLKSMPAMMEVRLWRNRPLENTRPPDMRFLLRFE